MSTLDRTRSYYHFQVGTPAPHRTSFRIFIHHDLAAPCRLPRRYRPCSSLDAILISTAAQSTSGAGHWWPSNSTRAPPFCTAQPCQNCLIRTTNHPVECRGFKWNYEDHRLLHEAISKTVQDIRDGIDQPCSHYSLHARLRSRSRL